MNILSTAIRCSSAVGQSVEFGSAFSDDSFHHQRQPTSRCGRYFAYCEGFHYFQVHELQISTPVRNSVTICLGHK